MTDHPESVVEHALAHQVGDETERAYRRGDAFAKRRTVMRDWEMYLLSKAEVKTPRRPSKGARSDLPLAA